MHVASRVNASLLEDLQQVPVVVVPIAELTVAGSPRRSGENREHARLMAQSANPLPPILVHGPTMRVLDGLHRLRAAKLRGRKEIEARLVHGDEASSFVLAVQANTTRGLPLNLADRKAAAARILDSYPQWSDRRIASVAGLAHQTVAVLRKRPGGQDNHLDARVGRDDHRYPRDSAERREIARKLLADDSTASLREIARTARISPETVRSVRAGLLRGSAARSSPGGDPDTGSGLHAPGSPARRRRIHKDQSRQDAPSPWDALRADPAFRSTKVGRSLLRALSASRMLEDYDQYLIDHIPPHCRTWVTAAAMECALACQGFAEAIEQSQPRDGKYKILLES